MKRAFSQLGRARARSHKSRTTRTPTFLWFNSVYMKNHKLFLFLLSLALFSGTSWAAEVWVTPSAQIDAGLSAVEFALFHLHRNPELSVSRGENRGQDRRTLAQT